MKRIDLRGAVEAEIARLLAKPAFDEVIVSENVRKRIEQTFGVDLTPTALVEKIVQEVRQGGDQAVLDYTAKIDGVTLSVAGMEVSMAEIASAMAVIEPELLAALQAAGMPRLYLWRT